MKFMGENKFYDGTKLMSMKDINGNTPEIFICTSNRSAGKPHSLIGTHLKNG